MKVDDKYCLSLKHPELAKEWHPKRNGNLTPDTVSVLSEDIAWWLCPALHPYELRINNRVNDYSSEISCPICREKKELKQQTKTKPQQSLWITDRNRLSIRAPHIASLWHPTKNGNFTPDSFSIGHSGKAWWLCPNGHETFSIIAAKIKSKPPHCSKCWTYNSLPEMRLVAELSQIFTIENRFIIDKMEIDVFIPKLKIGIEYDGSFWHSKKNKMERDIKKTKKLSVRGIKIIRVRDYPLKALSSNDIEIKVQQEFCKKNIDEIIRKIVYISDVDIDDHQIKKYLSAKNFLGNELFKQLQCDTANPFEKKSLSYKYPEITKEWHPTKNKPLTPRQLTYGSGKKVWWKCEYGHVFEQSVNQRTAHKKGCPSCIDNLITIKLRSVHEEEKLSGQMLGRGQILTYENRLSIRFPVISKFWHPTKNKTKLPYDYGRTSKKNIWWLCPKNHEFEARISLITDYQHNHKRRGDKFYCKLCDVIYG